MVVKNGSVEPFFYTHTTPKEAGKIDITVKMCYCIVTGDIYATIAQLPGDGWYLYDKTIGLLYPLLSSLYSLRPLCIQFLRVRCMDRS